MPKRTNEFQKIIYLIQKQLAGQATVTQSKMLTDTQSKSKVEVDIVIEFAFAGTNLNIGIETTAKSRKATVEWIREMINKHEHLPINKTILVSKTGFTKEALKKAKLNKIDAVTIENAKKMDWKGVVNDLKNLTLGRFDFNIVDVSVGYNLDEAQGKKILLNPNLNVHQDSNSNNYSIKSYAQAIMGKTDLGLEVMSYWIKLPADKRKNSFNFTINATPEKHTLLEYEKGKFVQIQQISIKVNAVVVTTPFQLKSGRYLGEKIAYGSTKNIFTDSPDGSNAKVLISLTTKKGKLDSGSMMLPGAIKTEPLIIPMKIVEKKGEKEVYKNNDDLNSKQNLN